MTIKDRMQCDLMSAYRHWADRLERDNPLASDLSPPFLLSVTDRYVAAQRRILVVGQETKGWGWPRDEDTRSNSDANGLPAEGLASWADFVLTDQGVEGLCRLYELFDFAKGYPGRSSPFWNTFRAVSAWPNASAMWTNLYRADYRGGSTRKAPPEVRRFLLDHDRELLKAELSLLKPDVCLFFTGPYYDDALVERFPGTQFSGLGKAPERELARLEHPDLPERSYRLYHPNALWRQRKRDHLEQVRSDLS